MAIGDRIQIARQETLESIDTKINTMNTNLNATKNTANTISTNIGAANNSGGTATTGTVMGKLNAILGKTPNLDASVSSVNTNVNAVKNNTATNNTANATGVLSQKLSYIISNLIGATNNTGGSTTAGTCMAKANAILSHITSDTYGLSAIRSAAAGIKPSVTGVGATLYANTQAIAGNSNDRFCIMKAIAPVSGIYQATIQFSATNQSCKVYKMQYMPPQIYASSIGSSVNNSGAEAFDTCTYYFKSAIGSSIERFAKWGPEINIQQIMTLLGISQNTNHSVYFHANKGEPILLYSGSNSSLYTITSVVVTYQP